jgi:hypothetical protein
MNSTCLAHFLALPKRSVVGNTIVSIASWQLAGSFRRFGQSFIALDEHALLVNEYIKWIRDETNLVK